MARPRKVSYDVTADYVFKPLDFRVVKNRTKLDIVSKPIDWDKLDDSEKSKQWADMTNYINQLEANDVIKTKDLEKYFESFAMTRGFTDKDVTALKGELPLYVLSSAFLLGSGVKYPFVEQRTIGHINVFLKKLEEKKALQKKVETPLKKKVEKDPQKEMNEVLMKLEDLEGDFTLALHNKTKSESINFLKWLNDNKVDKSHVQSLTDEFEARRAEIVEAIQKANEDLTFSYSKWTTKQLKSVVAWYEDLINALKTFHQTKVITRKVRLKKPVPPEKLVKSLRYLPKNEELNIESVPPVKLVGSKEVWVYNVKTRKLGIYIASELNQQMTVKGSALVGFDPTLSMCKTLRKPLEQLPALMKTTKAGMKKAFKDIKSKEYPMNGRFNVDTIILKIS